ncbi:MAG: DUF5106 domain-containing protein [Bacteroidales bacterium]|nr:DUF5106 domain-containing protein [Bacteroidales bacterium]
MLHNKSNLFISLFFSLIAVTCTTKESNKSILKDTVKAAKTSPAFTFKEIDYPIFIDNKEMKIEYKLCHFWDSTYFENFIPKRDSDYLSNILDRYIMFLSINDSAYLNNSIKNFYKRLNTNKDAVITTKSISDHILYNPISNKRDDKIYEIFLKNYLLSPFANKETYFSDSVRLALVMKNQIGNTAIDFKYLNKNGTISQMHNLKAENLILFFYNPGCHACQETIESLKSSQTINDYIKKKKIKILAVFPDNNIDEWKNGFSEIPDFWINGYDSERAIDDIPLYDLKAIPTIYLLDKNKKVIIKDGTTGKIENFLKIINTYN